MQKLIEQLLDYNRKQADSAVELENVELAPLVETVVSAHSLPARAKMMHTRRRSQSNSLPGGANAADERTGYPLLQCGALRG
ncbi:sensor-like histidine kinase YfhK [Escherichia coli]|uniref:Sensor-like histidine kinase YfhK n=1 Tax=Escherichia coli TaxID=562 RepID=A0A2X1NAA7_ECOLX|nr:sensor-like histidine kinase YfhK [Escherichia coli]